jgi:hypothetical protein
LDFSANEIPILTHIMELFCSWTEVPRFFSTFNYAILKK